MNKHIKKIYHQPLNANHSITPRLNTNKKLLPLYHQQLSTTKTIQTKKLYIIKEHPNVHPKHFNLNLKHKSKGNIFNVCLSSLSLFNPSLNTITGNRKKHSSSHSKSNPKLLVHAKKPINNRNSKNQTHSALHSMSNTTNNNNVYNTLTLTSTTYNSSIEHHYIHQHHNSNNNIIISTPNDLVVPDEGFILNPLSIPYTKQIYTNTYLSMCFLSIFTQHKSITHTFISYLNITDINSLSQVNKHLNKHLSPFFHNHIKQRLILQHRTITSSNRIWTTLLTQSALYSLTLHTIYNKYVSMSSSYETYIAKDLTRTLPHKITTRFTLTNLYNVLKAYSNYNERVGYVQGMNFIVGMLFCKYENEISVFNALDAFITLLRFDNVIGIGHDANSHLHCAGKCIELHVKEMYEYFKKKNINHEIFTANWIITLFANAVDNEDVLFMIWEVIIIYKWKFIYCFIAAVIKVYQDEIRNASVMDLSKVMKGLLKREGMERDIKRIINVAFVFMFGYNEECSNTNEEDDDLNITTSTIYNNNITTTKVIDDNDDDDSSGDTLIDNSE